MFVNSEQNKQIVYNHQRDYTNNLVGKVSGFIQNIISRRFCEVLDDLLDNHIVDSVADFCRRIDYQPQAMSQIQKGKRDVTIDLIAKLFSEFRGSPFYVIAGIGPKRLDEPMVAMVEEGIVPYGKKDAGTDPLVKTLEQVIDGKAFIIKLLNEKISRLEADGLRRSKEDRPKEKVTKPLKG